MLSLFMSLYLFTVSGISTDTISLYKKDSTQAIFIKSLLNDYNNKDALIKSGIDSCGIKWIELIPSKILYRYYVDTIHLPFSVYKDMVTELLLDTNYFDRCNRSEIKGIKIDSDLYKKFTSLSTKQVINKFFKKSGLLKKKYKSYQYELYSFFYDKEINLLWNRNDVYLNNKLKISPFSQ